MTRTQVSLGMTLWLGLLIFMFSIPLWSYSSEKSISLAVLEEVSQQRAVVFFGFTQCGDVCPASMAVLRQVIKRKDTLSDDALPAVVFIDIDANSSTLKAQQYAQGFDSRFIGIHPDADTLSAMKAQFGLNLVQNGDNIQHQGRTYILEKRSQGWLLVKTVNPQRLDEKWLEQALFET